MLEQQFLKKHIALENKEKGYLQNDYSVYPEQLTTWLGGT